MLLEELSKRELGQEYKYKPGENDFVRQLANSVVMMLSFVTCGLIPVIAYIAAGINAGGIDSGLNLLYLVSGCSIIALFVLGMLADGVLTLPPNPNPNPNFLTLLSGWPSTASLSIPWQVVRKKFDVVGTLKSGGVYAVMGVMACIISHIIGHAIEGR